MIQRIQTVWLLLIALLAALLLFLPIAEEQRDILFCGMSYNLVLKILSGLIAGLSLTTLFLYKKRHLQVKLCFGLLFLLLISFIVIFDWSIGIMSILIPFIAIPLSMVLSALAIRAIRKDEKLVKAADRLR